MDFEFDDFSNLDLAPYLKRSIFIQGIDLLMVIGNKFINPLDFINFYEDRFSGDREQFLNATWQEALRKAPVSDFSSILMDIGEYPDSYVRQKARELGRNNVAWWILPHSCYFIAACLTLPLLKLEGISLQHVKYVHSPELGHAFLFDTQKYMIYDPYWTLEDYQEILKDKIIPPDWEMYSISEIPTFLEHQMWCPRSLFECYISRNI